MKCLPVIYFVAMHYDISESNTISLECFSSQPAFKIFVAYEDVVAGIEARRVYEKLNHSLPAAPDFHPTLWKFEALEMGCLASVASGEAKMADLVIISLRQPESLSPELKNWFANWVCTGPSLRNRALVVLLDQSIRNTEAAAVVRNYFKSIAHWAQMDCFVNYRAMQLASQPEWRGGNLLAYPDTFGHEAVDYRRWGINE